MKRVEQMKKDLIKFCDKIDADADILSPKVECTIERLYNLGYINGKDFIKWLDDNAPTIKVHGVEYISLFRLKESLKKYLEEEE